MKKLNNYLYASLFLLGSATVSCTAGFLDATDQSIVSSDDEKEMEDKYPEQQVKIIGAKLQAIYGSLIRPVVGIPGDFGIPSVNHITDVMTDDIALHTRGNGFFTFDYSLEYWWGGHARGHQIWLFYYSIISQSNEVLNRISVDTNLAELRAMQGQAYALRGYAYSQLAQLFQQTYVGHENAPGCPIYLSKNETGEVLGRASLARVYEQIDHDFKKSLALLDGWKKGSDLPIQIDQSVAAGLYARVCLVKNDWQAAADYARMARETSSAVLMTNAEVANDGFNSIYNKEWMWGVDITAETSLGGNRTLTSFLCASDAGYGGDLGCYRKIDAKLFAQFSASDARRKQFKDPKGSYAGKIATFPNYTNLKFKKVQGWEADYVYMRLSEMYLIEAEAYAQMRNYEKAAQVLAPYMATRDPSWSKTAVAVEEIYLNRRMELWGEGFALFDHLRLKKGINRLYTGSNHLPSAQFNVVAGSWYFLFQISNRELENNAYISVSDQNPNPNKEDMQTTNN
ncbi:MAG: RagB/SusD family nutrient uptake outer membrane protein [Bacteroidales bacterium]